MKNPIGNLFELSGDKAHRLATEKSKQEPAEYDPFEGVDFSSTKVSLNAPRDPFERRFFGFPDDDASDMVIQVQAEVSANKAKIPYRLTRILAGAALLGATIGAGIFVNEIREGGDLHGTQEVPVKAGDTLYTLVLEHVEIKGFCDTERVVYSVKTDPSNNGVSNEDGVLQAGNTVVMPQSCD